MSGVEVVCESGVTARILGMCIVVGFGMGWIAGSVYSIRTYLRNRKAKQMTRKEGSFNEYNK